MSFHSDQILLLQIFRWKSELGDLKRRVSKADEEQQALRAGFLKTQLKTNGRGAVAAAEAIFRHEVMVAWVSGSSQELMKFDEPTDKLSAEIWRKSAECPAASGKCY